jgi:DNA mismatch repair protein MutS2
MNLSAATVQTLEFDKLCESIAVRAGSTLGREEILAMKPSSDVEVIRTRMRPVVETVNMIAFDDPVALSRVPDVRPALGACRTPGAMLAVTELLQIGEVLYGSRRLHGYITKRRDKYPALFDSIVKLTPNPQLEESLSNALDPGTETVRDSASPELRRLRRQIEQVRGSIREKVEKLAGSLSDNVVQDRLVTLRNGRHVIPIRESQKSTVQGIIHDQSSSGQTLFIEPMVSVEMGNRLRQLEHNEKQEVERILLLLTGQVAAAHDDVQQNLVVLAGFDATYAKASYCRELDSTEPVFNDRGTFNLRGARHPLLATRLRNEERGQELVPLELSFGDEDFWTLILTGPNAGGKTVALKTVGLLSLMAQSGLPIPARENSEFPVLSGVFADIGDKQSIENDLSTFSSHAANLGVICEQADENALVLLDEIGSSTDPDQGSALAMSMLGQLTERKTRTIATTHHGALKAFAHDTEGIENGSMAFDADTLEPTFHLRLRVPGSSYAFEIARRFGMPGDIVDRAAEIAGSDVGRVESLIQDLDETYRTYADQLETVETEREEIAAERDAYQKRLANVEERERNLQNNANAEARRILDGANKLIEHTVQDIKQSEADSGSIRSAHLAIADAKAKLDAAKVEAPEPERPDVSSGDKVYIGRLGQEGTVINDPGNSDRLLVEVGALRVEVSPREIEVRQKAEPPDANQAKKVTVNRDSAVSLEVDLRGLMFDEASEVVDRYLDDLSMAGMERATIIHGKGTGALRKKIGEFLRSHPLVRKQRLGGAGEGGDGVTVIELMKN